MARPDIASVMNVNVTQQVPFGRPAIELPSNSIIDANLVVTIIFTTLTPAFNGLLILVVIFSKQLRSQPYQWLLVNYLLSAIGLMFGFGIYRIIQIQNYRSDGFMKSSEQTNCGVARFFEFPLMTSNFCLFLLGCERYILLKYNRTINWFVLYLFLALPWTLSIYRYSFELTSSKEHYLNIPYVGLCIDISSEKEGRRILYTILNIAVPLILGVLSTVLAYYKAFAEYKEALQNLRRGSFSNTSEERLLLYRKRFVRKVVFQSINLTAILLTIRIVITTITSFLFSQFSKDDLSQDYKDRVGTIGVVIIYLETILIPIIYIAFNHMIQQSLINFLFNFIRCYEKGNTRALDVIGEEEL